MPLSIGVDDEPALLAPVSCNSIDDESSPPTGDEAAKGEDDIAHLKLIAIGQGDGMEIGRINLEHGDIGGIVTTDKFGGEFAAGIADGNLDFIRAGDDVVGGKDITLGGNDDTGAEALFLAGANVDATAAAVPLITEETVEERIVEEGITHDAFLDEACGVNIDDAGSHLFNDWRVAREMGIAIDGGILNPDIGRGLLGAGHEMNGGNQGGSRHCGGRKSDEGTGQFHSLSLKKRQEARADVQRKRLKDRLKVAGFSLKGEKL